jgi:UDP-2,3-diacylglucosamine pyrophosphatase LpxH
VTDGILQANAESLSIIKSLSSGAISLPPATAAGKPADSSVARVPVDVHVHYLIGNHDWFYAIPGQAFDALRSRIKDVMGLSGTGMFLHDPFSSEALMEIYRRHDLFARHGDIFDAFNFEGDRLASSLGDAIVVELLNRFPLVVENELGTQLSKECLAGLREIDNVRPLLLVPVWITGLLRRTCLDTELRDRVKRIWDRLADEFLDLDFVSQRQWTSSLFGSVTKLRWAIKFSQGVSLDHLSEVTAWVTSKLATSDGPFYPNAFGEKTFLSGEAKYIIYGHTHHHEIVPLDIRDRGTSSINQIYFNSGTWRAVHDQAQFRRSEQEFAGFHVLTYLAFFCEGERGGHPFETWSGALAFEDGQ